MNNMIIAVYKDDNWDFYNNKLEKVAGNSIHDKKIYAILPDQYFYFFQTDILAKRNIKKTVRAYAKTIFPEDDNFVSYIPNSNGIIGYIVTDSIKTIKRPELLDAAVLITTPFLIQYATAKTQSVYTGQTTAAVMNEKKLICYIKGNYEDIERRFGDLSGYRRTDDELMRNINDLTNLAGKHNKTIRLSISDKETDFDLLKLFPIITIAAVVVIAIVLGQIFRYESVKKNLSLSQNRIDLVYKKAFGNKKYQDPYGILLYKARQCETQKGIKPINIIYALSKAKKSDTRIDSVIYDKTAIRIQGNAANYNSLLSYLSGFNKILHIKAKIRNTKSVQGRLKFSIIYNLMQ